MTAKQGNGDVDETIAESFPASDPPAWTTTHADPPEPAPVPEHASSSMLDWANYRKQADVAPKGVAHSSPDLITGYRTIASAKTAANALDAKTRELIALAVAVTVRCDGCIATHAEGARKHGATKDEITEALGVAVTVNAGAALVYSARTL